MGVDGLLSWLWRYVLGPQYLADSLPEEVDVVLLGQPLGEMCVVESGEDALIEPHDLPSDIIGHLAGRGAAVATVSSLWREC